MVSTSPDDLGVAHMWNFTSALWIAEGVEDDVWGGDKAVSFRQACVTGRLAAAEGTISA